MFRTPRPDSLVVLALAGGLDRRKPRRRRSGPVLWCVLIASALAAQVPPGQGPLESPTAPQAQLRVRMQLGERALAAGDAEGATRHFRSALDLAPASAATLRALLAAAVKDGDVDAQRLWAIRWWPAAADERGSFKPPIVSSLRRLQRMLENPLHYPLKWVLAVPKGTDSKALAKIKGHVDGLGQGRFTLMTHERNKPFDRCAWGLFVDGDGVLRAASPLTPRGTTPGSIESWARKYRTRPGGATGGG